VDFSQEQCLAALARMVEGLRRLVHMRCDRCELVPLEMRCDRCEHEPLEIGMLGNDDIHLKTAGKWQKFNLVSGMASVASNMGWL